VTAQARAPVDPLGSNTYRPFLLGDWIAKTGQAMSGKTVTRADLCEAVYQKVGLSRTESATLVELVLKEITDCLERGETVKLSSFGSFVVRKKGQRIGRNPKTGKEVPISPRRVMVFKPSAILKQRINTDGDSK
jgi:integration host factor subunit alpha